MKRLSKMAFELRDVTIFYQRMVLRQDMDFIAFDHQRSKSRIHQILRIQKQRYVFFQKNQTNMYKQYWTESLMDRYVMQKFYHYEINCILQRYYIKLNGPRGHQYKTVIIDEVDNLPDNIEEMNEN